MLELQLEEELRHALREDTGLMLYYQPIYDLKTGQVSKLEALIRWQHPVHGFLAPDRFIAIAEANGLIAELDNWVLRKACEDLGELSRQGCEDLEDRHEVLAPEPRTRRTGRRNRVRIAQRRGGAPPAGTGGHAKTP